MHVVVVDGITHDLGIIAFANGHVVTSGTGHYAGSRQADIVNPSAVAAAVDAVVFGVGPLVVVDTSIDGIGGFGPCNAT